ncbi:MAG: hypothetical protein WAM91_17190 [Candidatus Acidiferrales bacterium]
MLESSSMEQAISRALRANLEGLQRQAEELHQAIGDLVSACASSRPANALPPTLRAQAAAASLAATLEVFSRFISSTGETARRDSRQEENVRAVSIFAPEAPQEPARPSPSIPEPMGATPSVQETTPIPSPISTPTPDVPEISPAEESVSDDAGAQTVDTATLPEVEPSPLETGGVEETVNASSLYSSAPPIEIISAPADASPAAPDGEITPPLESGVIFDLNSLPQEQQEMHRRANRVAKVSMQDIQMLKPDQVKLGREHHDLCIRLKGEIEKARKEYERRFGPILGHGVDYFYHWMVEVLAAGDPEALGEYPYSSPALQR